MKILFLHGLGQTKEAWQPTIQELKNIDSTCLEVISSKTKKQTFASISKNIEQSLQAKKEPIIICGLSLGSVLALDLYFKKPTKIAGLILIAPQYKMPTILIDLQNLIFKLIPQKFFTKLAISKKEMISLSSSMRLIDYRPKIKTIKCPVYIICGSKDWINKKASLSLHKLLPQSKFISILHAGHEINIDQPQKLAAVINKAYQEMINMTY